MSIRVLLAAVFFSMMPSVAAGSTSQYVVSLVADIRPGPVGSAVDGLAVFNNELFFRASEIPRSPDLELYKYDGTEVTIVADICQPDCGSIADDLTIYNGQLYFSAQGSDFIGTELYRTDGSSATLVKDLHPYFSSFPTELTVFNGQLVFAATTDIHDGVLAYDGSMFHHITTDYDRIPPRHFFEHQGALYFRRAVHDPDGNTIRELLLKYDGINADIVADFDISAEGASPLWFASWEEELYFSAIRAETGRELYKYDGSNVELMSDINAGPVGSRLASLINYNGQLIFAADDNSSIGRELYRYDGTGVHLIADINPGVGDSEPQSMFEFNGDLFFIANNGTHGVELFRYDGSTVTMVADINPGSGNGVALSTEMFAVFNGELYFAGNNAETGWELYKLSLVQVPLAGDYNRNGFVDAADYVLWRSMDGQTGSNLAADGNGDGRVDDADYEIWTNHFGQATGRGSTIGRNAAVPEPASIALFLCATALQIATRRQLSSRMNKPWSV